MTKEAIAALSKAQAKMGALLKNAANSHLKSKYADLGAVLDACQPALQDNGFAIMQPCGKDEHGQYVETVIAHSSGEAFTSRVYLVIGKQDMQGLGSAITYARRYGLMGMAGLAPEDDDGEATKQPPRNQAQDTPPKRDTPKPQDDVTDNRKDNALWSIKNAATVDDLKITWGQIDREIQGIAEVIAAKDKRKAELEAK